MDDIVLHDRLAVAPWMDPALSRLPGVKPLELKDWLIRDEVFAGQMALRDKLIQTREHAVHQMLDRAREAGQECLHVVLDSLREDPGYAIKADQVMRPDGVTVAIDQSAPLKTVGRLIQADVCLMQDSPDGHVLSGAILCFPGGWTLTEKIGRALTSIHVPVPHYDASVEPRVERLFNAIRPDQPLWRANAFPVHEPLLFHPKSEADPPEIRHEKPGGTFIRSERQALRRLPESRAVVFTIHTIMIPMDRLTDAQRESFEEIR